MNPLIGLYSAAPQSGKSAAAEVLQANGYAVVPFAETLKQAVVPVLEALGYSKVDALRLVEKDKHEVVPALGVTVRHMLQTMGTEWGRQCVHPELWLKCWVERSMQHEQVVCDDVRFVNEAELIKSLGGEVWLITRPEHGSAAKGPELPEEVCKHASEGGLATYPHFDRVLVNDGTLEDLRRTITSIVT